jgi:hypothetical protein
MSFLACLVLATLPVDPPPQQVTATGECASRGHPLFGCVVCAPGDADCDGVPDFVVADTGWNRDTSCPRAWLLSGFSDRVLFTRALEGGDRNLELGIIGVEDVDGDGVADWLLSPGWRDSHEPQCLTLVSGRNGAVLRELDPKSELPALVKKGGGRLHTPAFTPTVMSGKAAKEQRVALGDLDHDGIPDIAVGDDGWVEFRSGRDGKCLRRLVQPRGPEWTAFGSAIARLGDIDGDGLDDLAIASPDAEVSSGRVQAFSSGTGECLYTVDLEWAVGRWGERLASLGDVDGDGCCDLAIATMCAESFEPGQACIASGKSGKILAVYQRRGEGLLIASSDPRARIKFPLYAGSGYPLFGSVLANAGDMDRDGCGDFLIGDPGSPAGRIRPRAWLVSGKDLRVLATDDLPGCTYDPRVIFGERLDLGTCSDEDGDGLRDWVGGYRSTEPREGPCALLFSGAAKNPVGWRTGREAWPRLDAPLADLGDIDGDGRRDELRVDPLVTPPIGGLLAGSIGRAPIYSLSGASVPAEVRHFGAACAIIEDLDGDGVRDFVVGCDNRESFAPGRVFVFSGKSGRLLAILGRTGETLERVPLERKQGGGR